MKQRLLPCCLALVSTLVFSFCASTRTQQDQYVETIPLVRNRAYEQAAHIIQNGDYYKEKDRVLYYLDLGMLLHWAGEYEESNAMLTEAEWGIEELFTKSISKGIASGILNDNALDYAGEDYEDIYLNVFKALNYIALGDNEAAHVEARRVQIKLNLLEDKYRDLIDDYNSSSDAEGQLVHRETPFYNDVLARYISLLLYRAASQTDDARIDSESMDEAWRMQQQLYSFEKPPLPDTVMPQENRAVVNVLAFSGLGPVKLAETFYLHTGNDTVYLAVTDQSDDYVTDLVGFDFLIVPGIKEGIHFSMQFPRLEKRFSEADRVVLKLNGSFAAELSLLEKMELIAEETFSLRQPIVVGRTIIRAVIKNVAKEIGKSALKQGLSEEGGEVGAFFGTVIGFIADVAVAATEKADLRISQFFPANVRTAELMVEPGSYHVEVEYWNGNSLMEVVDHGIRVFTAGELNLIESYMLR